MVYDEECLIGQFFDVVKRSGAYARRQTGDCASLFLGQYRCLRVLADAPGPMRQRDLAAALHIRSTSLSELVAKLEEAGHIRRSPLAEDRRTYEITLTSQGRKRAMDQRDKRDRLYMEMFAPLNEEEKQALGRILTKIQQYYQEKEEEANV